MKLNTFFALSLAFAASACGPQVDRGGNPYGNGNGDGGGNASDDAGDPNTTGDGGGNQGGGDGGNMSMMGACDNPLDLRGCGCDQPGASRACYTGPAPTQNKGMCHDGMQTCSMAGEFAAWGPCVGDTVPSAEMCDDGSDHNCNGLKGCDDPDCAGKLGCCMPGEMRKCYTGPMGTDGVGPCHGGMEVCTQQDAWSGNCVGQALPGVEAGHCHDNVDNDCNGPIDCKDPACVMDQGCLPMQCQPGAHQPCYTGPKNTAGVGPCHGGMQVCNQQGQWDPACVGEVKPGQEFGHCHDGIDNDCNGPIDCKDFACLFDPQCQPMVCNPGAMQNCYDGPNGTNGVGPCKGGTQTCKQDGSGWGPCNGQVLPGMEGGHCADLVDNDCDGAIDCKDADCAAAPNCCVMGGGMVDGTIWAHSPSTLYRIDPNNWAVIQVGDFNAGEQITDIAVTPAGALYAISFSSIYSVDKNTAKTTFLGGVGGQGNNGLTFEAMGTLLAGDSSGDFKRINPANGQVTPIGSYGNSYATAGDLVAVGDGTLYATSSTDTGGGDASANNILLRIDIQSGKATKVGPIGFGAVLGLAYYNAHVIGFTESGKILEIDPQTGKGVQIAAKGIQFWGAGMSPLVSNNRCP